MVPSECRCRVKGRRDPGRGGLTYGLFKLLVIRRQGSAGILPDTAARMSHRSYSKLSWCHRIERISADTCCSNSIVDLPQERVVLSNIPTMRLSPAFDNAVIQISSTLSSSRSSPVACMLSRGYITMSGIHKVIFIGGSCRRLKRTFVDTDRSSSLVNCALCKRTSKRKGPLHRLEKQLN